MKVILTLILICSFGILLCYSSNSEIDIPEILVSQKGIFINETSRSFSELNRIRLDKRSSSIVFKNAGSITPFKRGNFNILNQYITPKTVAFVQMTRWTGDSGALLILTEIKYFDGRIELLVDNKGLVATGPMDIEFTFMLLN